MGGESNDYLTPGNWDQGFTPILTMDDVAIINGGAVQYDPTQVGGGDFTIANGGVLQLNGGSWTQAGGPAWIKLFSGGTINVAGGTFNQGSAGRLEALSGTFHVSAGAANLAEVYMAPGGVMRFSGGTTTISTTFATAADTSIIIDGGALTQQTGNFVATTGVNFSLTGGSFTLGGATAEFKPANGGTIVIDGGTLNAYVLSFDGADTILEFGSGAINLSGGNHFNGIYGGGLNKYVNFTLDSTGTFFIDNISEELFTAHFVNGTIRVGGVSDLSQFTITPQANGFTAQLTNPIPEPGTVALLGLAGLGYFVFRRRNS